MSQPSAVRFTPCRSVCNCPPSVSPLRSSALGGHTLMLFVGASCPCETTDTWRAEAPVLPLWPYNRRLLHTHCLVGVWWVFPRLIAMGPNSWALSIVCPAPW